MKIFIEYLKIIGLLLLFLLLIFVSFYYIPHSFEFFGGDAKSDKLHSIIVEYQMFYFYLSLAFSLLLAYIAYSQLGGVSKRMQADFLLDIDKRWGNSESLNAREIIHELYRESERKILNSEFDLASQETIDKISDDVGEQILKLRQGLKESDIKKFMILLNFLDFMETIGYLCARKYVEAESLNELCGYSLKFNYKFLENISKAKMQDIRKIKKKTSTHISNN